MVLKSKLKWYAIGLVIMTYLMGIEWVFFMFVPGKTIVVLIGAVFAGLIADASYSIGAGLFKSKTKDQYRD